MEIKRVLAAASLTVTLGAFASTVFAQVAGGFPSGGMPGAGNGTQTFQSQSPALGEPGTEAPASAAPIGAASSDFMASERNTRGEPELTLNSAIQDETRARDMEVGLEREIASARGPRRECRPGTTTEIPWQLRSSQRRSGQCHPPFQTYSN